MKDGQFIIETYVVPQLENAVRLSDVAAGIFEILPARKAMKKAIDKGLVQVNGKKAGTGDWIRGGEIITLLQDQSHSRPVFDLKLNVIVEDDCLAIVNKPAGIEVSGNKRRTLEHALPGNLKPSGQMDALQFPQAIHRLDFPTSGLVMVGKTRSATVSLNNLFAERHIQKQYLAVTIGSMPEQGEIELPIDGKPSLSTFKKLESLASKRFGLLNLVLLEPHTGRRHQLRKHLASLGNPVLGDREYGTEGLILQGKGLYLFAQSLKFVHPITGEEVKAEAEVPEKFNKLFLD